MTTIATSPVATSLRRAPSRLRIAVDEPDSTTTSGCVILARNIIGRAISEAMPWRAYGQMGDAELKAMYAYLRTVPALEKGNR